MTGWDDDVRAMVQICPDDNLCSGLVLPCLQPLSIHGSNERLQISASSTCPLKKTTLLKHGTIPFNTFFFFSYGANWTISAFVILFDRWGEGGIMKDPYIDTARGKKKRRDTTLQKHTECTDVGSTFHNFGNRNKNILNVIKFWLKSINSQFGTHFPT